MVKLMGYYQLPGSMPVQVSFEDLPEELMDAYVKRVTRFSSWGEMIDAATDRYAMLEITKGNK